MNNKEREEEHEKILEEVITTDDDPKLFRNMKTGTIILGSIIIILSFILWAVPENVFGPTARPGKIPGNEIIPELDIPTRPNTTNIYGYVSNNNPQLKNIAGNIVLSTCSEPSPRCYAESIFYFVQQEITYLNDPVGEYYELPQETLTTLAADCDGHAILLASLLQHVGIQTRFAYLPRHVYVEALVPAEGLFAKEYEYEWIALDATCKQCKVGQTI